MTNGAWIYGHPVAQVPLRAPARGTSTLSSWISRGACGAAVCERFRRDWASLSFRCRSRQADRELGGEPRGQSAA